MVKDQWDCVLNDLEELGDLIFLVLTFRYNIENISCCLRLLPFCSSTFHQTNVEIAQIRSEDIPLNLQISIAPSSSRSNCPCRRRVFSLFVTGYAWLNWALGSVSVHFLFKNMHSLRRWASSGRSSRLCFCLVSACKRNHFRLRFRGLVFVVVVLFVDQVCDQLIQSMRNSHPRVRIVFVYRFNSSFHSTFSLQVTGCDFQNGSKFGVPSNPTFRVSWFFISWQSVLATCHWYCKLSGSSFFPVRMPFAPLSGSSSTVLDMRASSKRGFLDVKSDPGLLSSLIEQLNKTMETVNKMDAKLDAKPDAKFDGSERRMDQMTGLHQFRLDKLDAELASQRQLLEDLRTDITLLRRGPTGAGPSGSDSLCVFPSSVVCQPPWIILSLRKCWCLVGHPLAPVPAQRLTALNTRNSRKSWSNYYRIAFATKWCGGPSPFRCKLPVGARRQGWWLGSV